MVHKLSLKKQLTMFMLYLLLIVLTSTHLFTGQQNNLDPIFQNTPQDIVCHWILPNYLTDYLTKKPQNPSNLWQAILLIDHIEKRDDLLKQALSQAETHIHKFGQDKSGLLAAFVVLRHLSPRRKEQVREIIRRGWELNPQLLKLNRNEAFIVEQDLRRYCINDYRDEYTYQKNNSTQDKAFLENDAIILSTHNRISTQTIHEPLPLRAYTEFYEQQSYYKEPSAYEVGGTQYRTITRPPGMYNCYILPPHTTPFIQADDGMPYDNLNKYFFVEKAQSWLNKKEKYSVFVNNTDISSEALLLTKINIFFRNEAHVKRECRNFKTNIHLSPRKHAYIDFFTKTLQQICADVSVEHLPDGKKYIRDRILDVRSDVGVRPFGGKEWREDNLPEKCSLQ